MNKVSGDGVGEDLCLGKPQSVCGHPIREGSQPSPTRQNQKWDVGVWHIDTIMEKPMTPEEKRYYVSRYAWEIDRLGKKMEELQAKKDELPTEKDSTTHPHGVPCPSKGRDKR